jgi:hypothetical protein
MIVENGSRFGRLTVLKIDESRKGKNSYYLCLCSCGTVKSILRSNLGSTQSCGCFRKEKAQQLNQEGPLDMLGFRSGKLLVIQRGNNTLKGQARWVCRCDCGKEVLVDGSSLRNDNSTSCGCKRSQTIKSKPSPAIDLTNKRFGRLVVLSRGKNNGKKLQWNCLCDCGKVTLKQGYPLSKGNIKSCGCLELENRLQNCSRRKIKHGLHLHPLYRKLQSIIARCHSITSRDYPRYNAKGRKVCEEWRASPKKFVEWCLENGWENGKKLSIDRINNKGDYSPENCQILTSVENTIKRYTDNGQGLVVAGVAINIREQCRIAKISPETVKNLLTTGYSKDCLIRYGELEHFQKIAVGKSITSNQPISIDAAFQIEKIYKSRSRPPGYTNYMSMMGRCYNSNNKHYSDYGARGITVCERWRNNFKQFLADMGPPPHRDAAVHRIDPNGNYEPSNCKWASRSENTRAMHNKS